MSTHTRAGSHGQVSSKMPSSNTKSAPEQIRNWLLAATSSVVVFLLLGYIIVESFIPSVELDGTFWFSQEFYARAGAQFLLDVARSAIFNPILFAIWTLTLLFVFRQLRRGINSLPTGHGRKAVVFSGAVSIVATISALVLVKIGAVWDPWLTRDEITMEDQVGTSRLSSLLLLLPAYHRLLPTPAVWIHVCLSLPVAGVLTWELWNYRSPLVVSRKSYSTAWLLCVLNFVVFVFSYGFNVYDWRVSRVDAEYLGSVISDPYNDSEVTANQPNSDIGGLESGESFRVLPPQPEAYLLARISDGYFFWVKNGPADYGRIVSSSKEETKTVSFRIEKAYSLRKLRSEENRSLSVVDGATKDQGS